MSQRHDPDVYTPLGRGRVVHTFPDGTVAVELSHGGGHVFRPDEVYGTTESQRDPRQHRPLPRRRVS
jgi:hypothetical protein